MLLIKIAKKGSGPVFIAVLLVVGWIARDVVDELVEWNVI